MIIFGIKGVTSIHQSGSFQCPACGSGAPFERKHIRNWFSLFFIPCIPLNLAADYLECKRCGGTFKPEVLGWNGNVPGRPPAIPEPQLRPPYDPKTGMPLETGPPPIPRPPGSEATLSYQSNGLATTSMVTGILALVTSFLICPAFVFIPLSLIFGFIALGRVKKGNGLVGGSGAAKVGIACSLVASLALVAMIVMVRSNKPEPTRQEPWHNASMRISTSSGGSAHGNTPEARALAEQYAENILMMHKVNFSKKNVSYVVHCELRDGKCAFLIHVPAYRTFTKEAKESLHKMAWSNGRIVAHTNPQHSNKTALCVALKGQFLFGSVMVGEIGTTSPVKDGTDEQLMAPFFTGPETQALDAEEPEEPE